MAKDDLRITLGGEIDELSAVLGIVRAEGLTAKHAEMILRIQNELLQLGTEIACHTPFPCGLRTLGREHVRQMEREIDGIENLLPPLKQFVIPGDTKISAYLHFARTVCRRAERGLVTLMRKEPERSPVLPAYLNRLSDLLFVMARQEEHGE